MTLIEVYNVYNGSDGEATKALYAKLEQLGPAGAIAMNLFRAHKSSARAKVYRGGGELGRGSYRRMAYERKQWGIDNLTAILKHHAEALGIRWGWGEDRAQEFHRWVLYVDLPTGQVSFHCGAHGAGPDYAGTWDGSRDEGAGRICRWVVELLLAQQEVAA